MVDIVGTAKNSTTIALLHTDGADGSTTIIDTSGKHTWTAVGGAQIDTAQSKFGTGSLLLDGSGDYLQGDGLLTLNADLTIDFWAQWNALGSDPWESLDGRLDAPDGNANYPGLLDSYAFRPPWQVAGVDYHVGIDRTLYPTNANLKSAATDTLPSGATRSSPTITVSGNSVVMDGWDFSVGSGWNLTITGDNATVSNCNFGYTTTFRNLSVNNTASDATITKNEFAGSTTDGLVGRGSIEINGIGTITITYNWVQDAYAIGMVMSQQTASAMHLVWKYNAMENAGCGRADSGGTVHGDWIQQYNAAGVSLNSQIYSFCLWYQSMDDSIADTQGLSLHSANTTQGPCLSSRVENNAIIIDSIAHASATVIVYPPNLNGTGTITDNYFDPSSAAGTDAINIDPEFNPTGQPGHGPFSGIVTVSGNKNMNSGATIT